MTKNKSTYLILFFIVCVGTFIRVQLARDNVLHHWDEKFHALVAKNCLNEPLKPTLYKTPLLSYDYTQWYRNHIWLHKQPLPLWLMAASMKLFGTSEFAIRLPSLLLSILLIVVVFFFCIKWYSHKVALLAAFFISINGLFIELGAGRVATDHYDVLFAAFIFIALFFSQQHALRKKTAYALLSGCFVGFALLTKWLPALIVLPIHALLLKQYTFSNTQILKTLGISFLAAIVIALPWQLYILSAFPKEASWEYFHHWLHITSALEGHADPGSFYYLNMIRINYSEIIYLPLAYLIYKVFTDSAKRYLYLALLVWIVFPILFFSLAKTKMQGYILFVAPALFIITAELFQTVETAITSSAGVTKRVMYRLYLISCIVLPMRYCYERSAFGIASPKQDAERKSYALFAKLFPDKTVLLNCKWPIECMFYTNYLAYTNAEITATEKRYIKSLGYTIVYLKNDLPDRIE